MRDLPSHRYYVKEKNPDRVKEYMVHDPMYKSSKQVYLIYGDINENNGCLGIGWGG